MKKQPYCSCIPVLLHLATVCACASRLALCLCVAQSHSEAKRSDGYKHINIYTMGTPLTALEWAHYRSPNNDYIESLSHYMLLCVKLAHWLLRVRLRSSWTIALYCRMFLPRVRASMSWLGLQQWISWMVYSLWLCARHTTSGAQVNANRL